MSTSDSTHTRNNPMSSISFTEHLSQKGLREGRYADVIIKVYGKEYHLHKFFLSRSPYFEALFNYGYDESKEFRPNGKSNGTATANGHVVPNRTAAAEKPLETYSIKIDDPYITQKSFELLLKRLYGLGNSFKERKYWLSLLAVGYFFSLNDLTDSVLRQITKHLKIAQIPKYLEFAQNRVGEVYETLVQACKFHLLFHGWERHIEDWDKISPSVIIDIVGNDKFFVPNEYYRALFIIKLIERRIENKIQLHSVSLLKRCLNERVIFSTISLEGLMELVNYTDKYGNPYIESTMVFTLYQSESTGLIKSITGDVPNHELVVQGQLHNYVIPKDTKIIRHIQDKPDEEHVESEYYSSIPPLRVSLELLGIDLIRDYLPSFHKKVFRYLGSLWTIYIAHNSGSDHQLRLEIIRNQGENHDEVSRVTAIGDWYSKKVDRPNYNQENSQLITYDDTAPNFDFPSTEHLSVYFKFYASSASKNTSYVEKTLAPLSFYSCSDQCYKRKDKKWTYTQWSSCYYSFILSDLMDDEVNLRDMRLTMVMGCC